VGTGDRWLALSDGRAFSPVAAPSISRLEPGSVSILPLPTGISLNAFAQQALADAEAKNNIPPGVSVTLTPVSGVGDQAFYLGGSGTVDGTTGYLGDLATTVGAVYISCFNFGLGSPPTGEQAGLTQICTQVVSRL
jgi:hypothetical protein